MSRADSLRILFGGLALALAMASGGTCLAEATSRESFDWGWKFARFGAMPDGSTRGEPVGAGAAPSDEKFDAAAWRDVDLPHDWGIEGPFRADLPNETGKLPWAGIGWYRKTFFAAEADRNLRVYLDFDGAMSHPQVFVNGRLAGGWAYGYSSFRIDITPFVRFGRQNLAAVRLDNPADSSRWYPGGGIYRHVWLVKTPAVHVGHWGLFVSTPEATAQQARVRAQTTVENASAAAVAVIVRSVIKAPDGRSVGQVDAPSGEIPPGGARTFTTELVVPRPQLWDLATPRLYVLESAALISGREVDRQAATFGVRTVEWKPDGFFLNGRKTPLQGVCNHHDLGPLGAAVNRRAIQRQLEILRGMGCNAIRTSHNPPAPELLDLCDRMGFVVLDELFDAWKLPKKPFDYHRDFDAWHERDVVNFVHRDRNHPCVVIWSSGNEIPEQGRKDHHPVSRKLTELFHREDPTRKVMVGCNHAGAAHNGFGDTLDVFGYNYKPQLYGEFRRKRPEQPLLGSETSSCVSSRGEYFFPVEADKSKGFFNYQVSSYDLYAPPWAMKPDLEWDGLDQNPHAAGEFVWTGFDYLGEPTPYNQDKSNALNFTDPEQRRTLMAELARLGGKAPSRSSYFGIIDICGFPKDRYYLYQSRWRPELKMAHLLPHWNWPERVGQVTPVHLYTSGDEAELFLNGASLGRKRKGPGEHRLVWNDVKYAPGELKAVAYKAGAPWAEAVRRTVGPAAALRLEADRARLAGDGRDLSFVAVKAVDARGDVVPQAAVDVRFTLTGPIEIVAVDNGDATSHAALRANTARTYNGLALAVLRTRRGGAGRATLAVSAAALSGASVELTVRTGK